MKKKSIAVFVFGLVFLGYGFFQLIFARYSIETGAIQQTAFATISITYILIAQCFFIMGVLFEISGRTARKDRSAHQSNPESSQLPEDSPPLTQCPACHEKIDDHHTECPSCGLKLK